MAENRPYVPTPESIASPAYPLAVFVDDGAVLSLGVGSREVVWKIVVAAYYAG